MFNYQTNLPPLAINPPIKPINKPSQGLMTSQHAVIETTPPNIPRDSSATFIIYLRLFLNPKENSTPDAPPAIAPFIVTTATLLANFQDPIFKMKINKQQ